MALKRQTKLIVIIFIFIFSWTAQARIISTIVGEIEEDSDLILALIDSKAMQRLKGIDQSGPDSYYTKNFPMFSRYDHSLGVYALLKKFKTSKPEQIAGLLHDASHTVMSHLGDIIFQSDLRSVDQAYQDNIHDWFLEKMQVNKILSKHKSHLTLQDIVPKSPHFYAMNQRQPDLNADRVEYILHTGLTFFDLKKSDVHNILEDLRYENRQWFFTNVQSAKKIARLSTYYLKNFWGSTHNVALYTVASTAFKYALRKKIITFEDLHFGIDVDVINKLNSHPDPILKKIIHLMRHIDKHYVSGDKKNYDVHRRIKMRAVDPLVLHYGKLERLTNISVDYYFEYQTTKQYAQNGVYVKFKNINQDLLKILKSFIKT